MNQTQAKEITMSELAIMINNGFKESHRNLMEVKTELSLRIDGVERRLGGLEQRFDRLEQKVDGLEKKMDYRFDGLQKQIDSVYLNYTHKHDHVLLKERVRKVEGKIGKYSPIVR